jgi:riboflavin kinase / FMN adenylyltransferase
MRVIRLESFTPVGWRSPVVTVGNFDGVHRGHQALAAAAVEQARREGGTAVVLTFDPHPARVLAPERAPAALTTAEQKRELLSGLGIDALAVLPFDARLAAFTPGAFVLRVLRGALAARHVVVGEGFRFGQGQSGDAARLVQLGAANGFSVEAVASVTQDGEPVSSSRVREQLARGGVDAARALLGRSYFVDGTVVAGDQRGRTIGVPTANLQPENEIMPARGVYAACCRLAGGRWLPAVVNVGSRPTFGGGLLTVEAHLLDFEGDLYGSGLRVAFEQRLRDERRFDGREALVAQIREDVARARALLSAAAGGGL